MQLIYSGPHPEVEIDALGPDHVITAGVPVEIPDVLAASLLEQDTWSEAPTQTAPAVPAPTTEPTTPTSTPDAATVAPTAPQTTGSGS